jgi:hypothetical protein
MNHTIKLLSFKKLQVRSLQTEIVKIELSQPAFLKRPKKTIDKLDFFCKFIDVDINYFAFLDLEEGSAYGSHESPMDIEMGNVLFLLCPSGKSCNLNLGRKERKLY